MKAIVLAAGIGRRMRPLSDRTHKALLPVGDTTILGRIVEGLAAIGVDDAVVVTGHRSDEIRAYLSEHHPRARISYVHNERYRETNNIVSLSLALEATEIDTDILLVECDLVFDPDVLALLVQSGPGNIALVDRWRPGMDGTVVSVEGDYVAEVFPVHRQGESFRLADKWKTLNIYRFDRDFCRDVFQPLLHSYANLVDGTCYYELVLGMLVNMQRHRVRAVDVGRRRWAEVDDANDLETAAFVFQPEGRKEILDHAFGGFWNFDVLDFASIRNACFPTEAMIAAMREALPELIRGYGSRQSLLDQKMARFLGCAPERVITIHGAAQAFPWIARCFGEFGRVLIPTPTFGEYRRTFPDAATYDDTGDPTGLPTAAPERGQADLVVFVNPNNPTGTITSTEAIHDFARTHRGALVLVDESFLDFSDQPSIVPLVEAHGTPNVLVLKSLSKSLGVPGLRLGYLYTANADWHRRLAQQVPIWNLSSPTEFFLELLLKFRNELEDAFECTKADREQMAQQLREQPGVARVYPSGGNFLLVQLADGLQSSAVASQLLTSERIYIKDLADRYADGRHVRVAVRRSDENERLVQAIDRATGSRS